MDKAYCLKQAKEYFANIVLPYTTPVQAKLNLILGMNLDIEYIMPAHGIIWKDYIADIIETYKGILVSPKALRDAEIHKDKTTGI